MPGDLPRHSYQRRTFIDSIWYTRAGGVGQIRHGWRRKARWPDPLLGEVIADQIREPLVHCHNLVRATCERTQPVDILGVAWQQHPITVPTAHNRSRVHTPFPLRFISHNSMRLYTRMQSALPISIMFE